MKGNKKIVAHTEGKESNQQKHTEETQSLDLLDKDFESVILNMFKELKETASTEQKECMRITVST